jgi:hypothetical protein
VDPTFVIGSTDSASVAEAFIEEVVVEEVGAETDEEEEVWMEAEEGEDDAWTGADEEEEIWAEAEGGEEDV